ETHSDFGPRHHHDLPSRCRGFFFYSGDLRPEPNMALSRKRCVETAHSRQRPTLRFPLAPHPRDVVANFVVASVVAHAVKLPPITTVAGVPITTTIGVVGVAIVIAGVAPVVAITTVAGVVATVVAIATVTVAAMEHVSLL